MLENNLPYVLIFILLTLSIYGLLLNKDYFKKLICLAIMQSSIIIFYILLAYVNKGKSPFLNYDQIVNPLPHVLMLTAIVVGLAILSVGLVLVLRLKEEFSTIDEKEIENLMLENNK